MVFGSGERRRGPTPLGLLGMLGLLVGIECILAGHERDFLTLWCADRRETAAAVDRVAPPCPILCFGDSQVKLGIVPRLVESRTGRRAHNFALHGGQAPASYFLFRRALASGAKPRAVLVDFESRLLWLRPQANVRPWSEFVSLGEAIDLSRTARDSEFLGALGLARWMPSFGARFEIRAAIREVWTGKRGDYRANLPAFRRNWLENDGAQVMPVGPSADLALSGDLTGEDRWFCDATNAAYVDRFLKLAAERGVRLFWLLPPIHPKCQAERDCSRSEASIVLAIRQKQKRYANLTVLDARHSGYHEGAFFDAAHLNALGANALSTSVADALSRHLGASPERERWVKLAPFHDRAPAIALEDMVQSELALWMEKTQAKSGAPGRMR